VKILMLKMDPPFPLESGTDWVSYHLLRALASEHQITYVTLTRSDDEEVAIRELEKHCTRVISVRQPNLRSPAHRVFYKALYLVLSLLTGTPTVVWYNTPRNLRRKVCRLLREESFDIVHVEYWYSAPYARYARTGTRVLLKHDVAYVADRRLLPYLRSGPSRWWWRWRTRWLKRAELGHCRLFDRILTLTEADQVLLEEALRGHPPVRALPTLFLPFPEGMSRSEQGLRLVFLGHLGRPMVVDAVTYFCDEVLPRIQREIPETVFEIIGGGEHRVRHLASRPGVELAGFVRDVAGRIEHAAVMVVPLRAGSGIKVKIIEALAAGLPIVTTSVGAEGIGLRHEDQVMIADSPEAFARCTVALLRDPGERRRMAERGRQFVRERYGSDRARRMVAEFYADELVA